MFARTITSIHEPCQLCALIFTVTKKINLVIRISSMLPNRQLQTRSVQNNCNPFHLFPQSLKNKKWKSVPPASTFLTSGQSAEVEDLPR